MFPENYKIDEIDSEFIEVNDEITKMISSLDIIEINDDLKEYIINQIISILVKFEFENSDYSITYLKFDNDTGYITIEFKIISMYYFILSSKIKDEYEIVTSVTEHRNDQLDKTTESI